MTSLAKRLVEAGARAMFENALDSKIKLTRYGLLASLRALLAAGPSEEMEEMERAGYERISEGIEEGRIVSPSEVFCVMLSALISELEATDA